jgi:hypothetical protein
MQRALTWLEPYEANLPTVFSEYLLDTLGLPLGTDRLHWDREKDAALEQINRRFRDRVFDAAWAIIDRFGRSPQTDGSRVTQ